MKAKRIDWVKAKLDYVNDPTLRHQDIAQKYGVPVGSVYARAKRESWTEARESRSKILQESVRRKSVSAAAVELAKYNEQDIAFSKSIRSVCAFMLNAATEKGPDGKIVKINLNAKDVRQLQGAVESAQRVARLALGASTTNIGDQPIEPLMGDINFEDLSDEQLISFQQNYSQLLSATFGGHGQHTEAQGGAQVQ